MAAGIVFALLPALFFVGYLLSNRDPFIVGAVLFATPACWVISAFCFLLGTFARQSGRGRFFSLAGLASTLVALSWFAIAWFSALAQVKARRAKMLEQVHSLSGVWGARPNSGETTPNKKSMDYHMVMTAQWHLKADGTFSWLLGDRWRKPGTWKIEGDKLILSRFLDEEEERYSFEIKPDRLVGEDWFDLVRID